ncbi:hypothetical protein [Thermogemmatispora sp.]|uniref:hypothetical protein n=1 Tax=Thermogemmatispora sp. TaxID=1968838 RepID=UPI001D4FFF3B|nr:hypothetical protein [Thermogemmatispora sp.]MBX5451595.1 hypothetical protein [Thermogemmatispora sp.]
MQQAYRALRILAEAQTVRMMLTAEPCALLLDELASACAALQNGSAGLTCVILDFGVVPPPAEQVGSLGGLVADCRPGSGAATKLRNAAERAAALVRAVPQPVLAVVRAALSEEASLLVQAADLVLIAREATLIAAPAAARKAERLPGEQAVRLGLATWCTPARQLDRRLEEVLTLLRRSSALALRQAKAAVRLALRWLPPSSLSVSPGGEREPGSFSLPLPTEDEDESARQLRESRARLEALRRVNTFYLSEVSCSEDAQEGLQAFLEKRAPRWQQQQREQRERERA